MDCGCCSGILHSSNTSSYSTSTLAQWRSIFSVKLDAMHLMQRISREMNAEHPRRKKFLIDLSQAIFIQHQPDVEELMKARAGMSLQSFVVIIMCICALASENRPYR